MFAEQPKRIDFLFRCFREAWNVTLANPADRSSDFGSHCEPINGWSSINPEQDHEWDSRMGWHVLRLDGLRSPNIILGYDKYPFLLTNKGLNRIRDENSENSFDWWCYIRAWYPPEGVVNRIFSPDIIDRCKKPFVWYSRIEPCASCDPAFEGGDDCVLTLGHMGKLSDRQRFGVKVEKFVTIKRQNPEIPVTIDFGNQIIALCKSHGVDPSNFILDSTGNALGLSDYIRHTWSMSVIPISFGGAPTQMRILGEDSKKAEDRFDRFVSELWFSAREWCKAGLVWLHDCPRDLTEGLEARIYELMPASQKIKIEPKDKMKKRGHDSPDYADSFCLLIHLLRIRSEGYIPSFAKAPEKKVDPLRLFRKHVSNFDADYGVKEVNR